MKRATLMMVAAGLVSTAGVHAAEPAQGGENIAGRDVYLRWCSHCHSTGRGNPGTESLQVKYGGKLPAALLERTDLAPEAVSLFVRQGVLSMPPFRKTEITDTELAQLAAFVARNYKR